MPEGTPSGRCPAHALGSLITRIHGRVYDLGAFEHPGGCPALECARERDSTELFESYHALFRERPLRELQRYALPEGAAQGGALAPLAGAASIDWNETLASPFRSELVALARRYFEAERRRRGLRTLGEAMRAPPRRWLEIAVLAGLFFASLVPLLNGMWAAVVVTPLLGWLFLVNFWHDALHFALSRSWRVNALIPYLFPWFMSPKLWLHQHVVGHHAFTNEASSDPDIHSAPALLRQSPSHPFQPAHALQRHLTWLLFLYASALPMRNLFRDHLTRRGGMLNGVVPLRMGPAWRRVLHVLGRLGVAASLFVWPFYLFPWSKALAFALLPSMVLSLLFAVFTQINHLTDAAGDPAHARASANWYVLEALRSCSYAPDSYAAFLLSGGLNLQIEHHLLPGVNHAHLVRLSSPIRALCAKHAVPYNCLPSLWSSLRAHFAFMRRLGEAPMADAAPSASRASAAGE